MLKAWHQYDAVTQSHESSGAAASAAVDAASCAVTVAVCASVSALSTSSPQLLYTATVVCASESLRVSAHRMADCQHVALFMFALSCYLSSCDL